MAREGRWVHWGEPRRYGGAPSDNAAWQPPKGPGNQSQRRLTVDTQGRLPLTPLGLPIARLSTAQFLGEETSHQAALEGIEAVSY